MPYSRTLAFRGNRRRSRKSTGRKRTNRKRRRTTRRTRRSRMGRRAILNITSRKKKNVMLTWTNQQGTAVPFAQQPLILNGGQNANLAWVMFRPTGMDLQTVALPNTVSQEGARTSTNCYMVGLSEHIRIETSTGNPWFHRRVCFTSKNPVFYTRNPSDSYGIERDNIASGVLETSRGAQRLAANMTVDTLNQTYLSQKGVLFKGSEGVDWDDVILAPVDTTRVDLKYDKTRVYSSGNASGILREIKLFHPMKKSLIYDDDQVGVTEDTNDYSVLDKRGMGNYHVLDIFSQGTSGAATDRLSFRCNSTMYWHER